VARAQQAALPLIGVVNGGSAAALGLVAAFCKGLGDRKGLIALMG
jgi:hypothetical protein